MNKLFIAKSTSLPLLIVLMLSSCMDKDVYQDNKNKPLNPTEVFDFSLTKQANLNIDYGFTNDYYILFELYDQNPMIEEEDSWTKNEALTSIYSASTDKKGKYSGSLPIPSDITEVWLYSAYPGAVSPVKLTVSSTGEINFNQAEYIASLQVKTRGTTPGGYTYPDDWMTIPGMDWDAYGLPSNIEADINLPSADILYSIKKTYSTVKKEYISVVHPDWVKNNATSGIEIIKDTELSLVFMSSGAAMNNTVGYFTFPTGTPPTEESIQKILAFPNVSPISKMNNNTGERKGALLCGHEVKLKYWNKTKQAFEDKFPAGVTVGWCLQKNSFQGGDIKNGNGVRYSHSTLNKDNRQCVVALNHQDTGQTVAIGFEDNTDDNYSDAIFYINVEEANAVSTEGPALPLVSAPGSKENALTYKGTLIFEDQWPLQGDYDMNDVIVEYQSTLYRNVLTNKVYKIVDEFTPTHNGGSYACGFGYQLYKLEADRVRSIEVSGPDGWKIETVQSHPTITLFDNIKTNLGKKFTVTTQLADVEAAQVTPPYNPFIFVKDRSREVHLVNYPPTGKADYELFDTGDDLSNISEGVYYIARYEKEVDLMPFCINLPILGFKIPDEGVKIYNTYPDFIGWVKSKGETNKDWYKK